MIRSSLTSLAGIVVAREVERGSLPTALSVPLTVIIARLPLPALLLGAAGYGAYKLATTPKAPRRSRRARAGQADTASARPRPPRRTHAKGLAKG